MSDDMFDGIRLWVVVPTLAIGAVVFVLGLAVNLPLFSTLGDVIEVMVIGSTVTLGFVGIMAESTVFCERIPKTTHKRLQEFGNLTAVTFLTLFLFSIPFLPPMVLYTFARDYYFTTFYQSPLQPLSTIFMFAWYVSWFIIAHPAKRSRPNP